jgi:hypothetical protein
MHVGKGRLGFVLKMASWLSLPHLGFSCILAFFDFLGNLFYGAAGSSSCKVSSCKPLLAANTLLKMYLTADLNLQIINVKTI